MSTNSITTVASVTNTIVSLAQSLVQLHKSIGSLTSNLQPILRPSTDDVDDEDDFDDEDEDDSQLLLNQTNPTPRR
jgi:hypothetical protein